MTLCPFKCKPMQERGRFFLIILNLATIEVIMHLEEQTLDEIMNNSELLGRRGQVYLWLQPSSGLVQCRISDSNPDPLPKSALWSKFSYDISELGYRIARDAFNEKKKNKFHCLYNYGTYIFLIFCHETPKSGSRTGSKISRKPVF